MENKKKIDIEEEKRKISELRNIDKNLIPQYLDNLAKKNNIKAKKVDSSDSQLRDIINNYNESEKYNRIFK